MKIIKYQIHVVILTRYSFQNNEEKNLQKNIFRIFSKKKIPKKFLRIFSKKLYKKHFQIFFSKKNLQKTFLEFFEEKFTKNIFRIFRKNKLSFNFQKCWIPLHNIRQNALQINSKFIMGRFEFSIFFFNLIFCRFVELVRERGTDARRIGKRARSHHVLI